MIKSAIKRFKQMSPAVKSSLVFALASALSAGMSYITTPIFTRIMPSEDYGSVSVFLTWQSVLGIIAMFSLNYGVFNNGMMDYSDRRDDYSFSLLGLSNIITVVTMCSVIGIKLLVPSIINIDIQYLILMFVVYLFQPAYNFWLARQRYEYKYKAAFFASSIIAVVAPLVSVICVICVKSHIVQTRIYSLEIVLLSVYCFFYFLIGRRAKWNLNKEYWKDAFLFNLPLLPHYLSVYILSSSDKIMISQLVGNSETSYYSVAYTIASLGLIIWTAINGSLIPYTYEKCKTGDFLSLKRVTNFLLLIIACSCVMVLLIAPEVMTFLGSDEYQQGLAVIPPIVGGIFFQVHYSIYANVLYYYRKPRLVMFASVLAAIINVISNYFFIKKFGYVAAGYTTLFCYLIQAIIDYFAIRMTVHNSVYDIKFIVILSAIILLFTFLMPLIYGNSKIRFFILFIMFIVCFVGRKKLIKIIVGMRKL